MASTSPGLGRGLSSGTSSGPSRDGDGMAAAAAPRVWTVVEVRALCVPCMGSGVYPLASIPPEPHAIPYRYNPPPQPCGQPGSCPYVNWGGAVLLAPPPALPALAPGGGYGDAVRINLRPQPSTATTTSTATGASIDVIARLHPLLPAAGSCLCASRCGSSAGSSYTVVLPHHILVALPSSDASAAAATDLVLPAAFEARIEMVPSSR